MRTLIMTITDVLRHRPLRRSTYVPLRDEVLIRGLR